MNSSFEHHYKGLLSYCLTIKKDKHLVCSSYDLLNDAYLKFAESGEGFDLEKFKAYIVQSSFLEVVHQVKSEDITNYKRKESKITDHVCCIKCHEVKPANAFQLANIGGIKYHRTVCDECRKIGASAASQKYYRKKQLEKGIVVVPRIKKVKEVKEKKPRPVLDLEKRKQRNKNWFIKNRDKWNAYMRKRTPKKGRKPARPIHELWREANHRRYEKVKMLRELKKQAAKKPYEFYRPPDVLENLRYHDTDKPKARFTSYPTTGSRYNLDVSTLR